MNKLKKQDIIELIDEVSCKKPDALKLKKLLRKFNITQVHDPAEQMSLVLSYLNKRPETESTL